MVIHELVQDKGRTAKPQVVKMWRHGNAVTTVWGQLGGAQQETTQTFDALNIGKANEKSAEQVAQEWLDRQILLKTRRGYRDVGGDTRGVVQGDTIDFMRLPQNLRFYKPQNSMNVYMEKLVEKGTAWFVRKRNGNMAVVAIDEEGEPRMYSSTLDPCPKTDPHSPWLDRFPHIEEDIRAMGFPARTVLLGEIVASLDNDDLEYVGSVMRAKTARALETQDTHGHLCLCLWDIAFHGGQQLLGVNTYEDRMTILESYATKKREEIYITIPEILTGFSTGSKTSDALLHARVVNWEGYVVVDPTATYADRGFTFHGKAERPKECCKLKPTYEADFIARWDPANGIGTWGKGRKSAGVGAVFLYLLDDKNQEVFVSKVGGGFTEAQVIEFADPKRYPKVWQVEFARVTEDGSLEFPVFVRERDDKEISECKMDQILRLQTAGD